MIIRKVAGPNDEFQEESYYKGSRCTAIYKYKEFKDDEGNIIGAEAANGGHSDEGVIWHVQDKAGRQFKVTPRGDVNIRKEYYRQYQANPQQFIGLQYRYRYQELSEYQIPRFPVGLGFVFDR